MKRTKTSTIVIIAIATVLAMNILMGLVYYSISTKFSDYIDDYPNLDSRNYVGRSIEECRTIQVLCVEGFERFDDEMGCGCEAVKTFCNPEQRNAEACIEIYQPVCGFSSSDEKIKTFSNSCFACMNENVEYYTEGECPSP